jgi:uncharacterized protein YidB (DUF937 family)
MAKGYPPMLALLGLVAVAGYQNREKIAEMVGKLGANAPRQPGAPQGGQSGGLGGLDGLLGSLRGALGGVAGAGASASGGGLVRDGLGELVDRFQRNGRGDVAQSWVNRGPNQDIAPADLEAAIGSDVLVELSQRTGLSRDELLTRLSRQLPSAVDRYTPDGRLPEA